MGIGNLFYLVVMVTLPGPSLQALGECSYDSTDVYVLFEASTFSTQFLGGMGNYLKQIQDIAWDAVSTGPASRVSITTFTSDGPREYVAINSGFTSWKVDSTIEAVSATPRGGSVSDALSYIINKNIVSDSSGNPVTLVVIFTSALTNLVSVKSHLHRLTAAQVDVHMFPVGILAFNSASTLPHVTYIISNVINFGQTVTDRVFQCNENPGTGTGDPNDLCYGWHGRETGLYPYAGRCDKFYQCSHKVAYEMPCPVDQLYDKEQMVCDHAYRVLQSPTSGCALANAANLNLQINCTKLPDDLAWWACTAFGMCQNDADEETDCINETAHDQQDQNCVPVNQAGVPCNREIDCQFLNGTVHGIPELEAIGNFQPCQFYYTCNYGNFTGYHLCGGDLVYSEDAQNCQPPEFVPPPCGTRGTNNKFNG